MMFTQRSLPRRTFLRGIGTTLALPLLDAMVPAMAATRLTAAKPVVRLGFVYVPNGIIQKGWLPSKTGTGYEMASTMKPLEAYREKMLVLSNLMQNGGRALGDGAGDHARAGATWLTGVHPKKTEGSDIHAAISADQIAADEFGKKTQLASLEIGLEEPSLAGGCDSGYSCAYTNTISWRNPTMPNPMEVNPRAVFERLFGDGETTDPAARLKRMNEDRSILDFVRGDVARLEPGLGSRDKRKLDEYLEGIRDIERRIQKAEEQNATVKIPVFERPDGIPDEFEEHAKLMSDLMVIAFQTDMTRVVSFMMAREGSNRSYRSIGISDGHHSVTHHQNDPEKIAKTMKIDQLHVKTFGYLLGKLDATPDGDGTLLDHSMILFGSSISDGNAHTHHDLPLVLAGGAAGQVKGGRHVRYAPETPMNNLLLTMLDKSGVHAEKLGDSTGKLDQLSDV
ncbi:MAG: DUF1552 domain-containing protein [Acidobacteriota bacterium]|nr:DUF1552 domain-containing protein [Acidobacteriota bacterium]